MANPYLDQIELPSGNTYDLVDSGARDLIAAINNWEYVVCTSAANTPKDVTWDDGGTTITGTLVAASTTMYKIYLVPSINGTSDIYDEYVTVNPSGSTYTWEMFGNTKLPDMTQYVKNKSGHSGGTAGELGYKDTASGSTTVAVPKTYTTTFTGKEKSVSVSGTPDGSVSSSFTGSDTYFKTASEVATGASFTGSSMTSSGKFTPSGSVSLTNSNQSTTVTPAESGTSTYTPSGSVAAPTISVVSAGATTSINNPTKKTVVTDMSVANPSSTTATGELVYCSVSGTKLSLKKFVETTGDSISTTATTVKTGDASYSASAPAFTGTGVRLVTGNISVPSSASFSGTEGNVSVSGTTTGSVNVTKGTVEVAPSATGTAANKYTPGGSVSSSFTGTAMTSTGTYTPEATSVSTTTATTEDKTVTITVS